MTDFLEIPGLEAARARLETMGRPSLVRSAKDRLYERIIRSLFPSIRKARDGGATWDSIGAVIRTATGTEIPERMMVRVFRSCSSLPPDPPAWEPKRRGRGKKQGAAERLRPESGETAAGDGSL